MTPEELDLERERLDVIRFVGRTITVWMIWGLFAFAVIYNSGRYWSNVAAERNKRYYDEWNQRYDRYHHTVSTDDSTLRWSISSGGKTCYYDPSRSTLCQ